MAGRITCHRKGRLAAATMVTRLHTRRHSRRVAATRSTMVSTTETAGAVRRERASQGARCLLCVLFSSPSLRRFRRSVAQVSATPAADLSADVWHAHTSDSTELFGCPPLSRRFESDPTYTH